MVLFHMLYVTTETDDVSTVDAVVDGPVVAGPSPWHVLVVGEAVMKGMTVTVSTARALSHCLGERE
jgi:hypothetical protein